VTKADLQPASRFLTEGSAQVIIFTTSKTEPPQVDFLQQKGAQVYVMGERQVDMALSMQKLLDIGGQRLLVEGGGILIESHLRLKLIDEIYIYVAPLIFGGANVPTIVNGAGLSQEGTLHLQLITINRLGDGGALLQYLPLNKKNPCH
jgi:riboflavin biosynthesis pyrimidine reductase